MSSSHLILCRPLLLLPHNPSQHQGLFQWVNSSYEVAKVLEFQLQHQSFQWTPRTDLPYFLQFKSEFCNKEFMIWVTVSSRSCFCWLYRASPSLAAKNIINLWCPCVESSLVLEEGVCYDQCIFLAKLLVFALLHSTFQGQFCLLLQVFLDFLFLLSSPL